MKLDLLIIKDNGKPEIAGSSVIYLGEIIACEE
jgi:hypothetical protein